MSNINDVELMLKHISSLKTDLMFSREHEKMWRETAELRLGELGRKDAIIRKLEARVKELEEADLLIVYLKGYEDGKDSIKKEGK